MVLVVDLGLAAPGSCLLEQDQVTEKGGVEGHINPSRELSG